MSKTRNIFSPEFKAQVVLQLLREENTVNELSSLREIEQAQQLFDLLMVNPYDNSV